MSSNLKKTAETLLQLIDNYGCLSLSQAAVICGGDEEAARRNLSHLILIHCIHERNGLYVPVVNPKTDFLMISSLWVAINKCTNDDGTIDMEALTTSFPGSQVNICLVMKDKFYNIVMLTKDNISSTLPFLMDRFEKNYKTAEKAKGQEYIFVVRDMLTIKQIAEFNPNMPNRIALIEGDILSTPTIRYLSPKKS